MTVKRRLTLTWMYYWSYWWASSYWRRNRRVATSTRSVACRPTMATVRFGNIEVWWRCLWQDDPRKMKRRNDVARNHQLDDMYQNNVVVEHNHCLPQYLLKRGINLVKPEHWLVSTIDKHARTDFILVINLSSSARTTPVSVICRGNNKR